MAEIENLDDLLDVDVPSPVDGDVVYWDGAAAKWKCRQPSIAEGILEMPIVEPADDIDVYWNGSYYRSYLTNLWWIGGYNGPTDLKNGGGGRFKLIHVPPGATILHAYLKLTARNSDNLPNVNTRLRGELNINPATFGTLSDYLARKKTTAVIDWDNIPPWVQGTQYQSPDIKSVIQEIIDLDGWVSGNPVIIFWDDHDDRSAHISYTIRRARSYDHPNRTPPILYIEYAF